MDFRKKFRTIFSEIGSAVKWFLLSLVAAVIIFPAFAAASSTDGTIPSGSYAWGENLGWINFGCDTCDIHVTESAVTGHAWSDDFGWINFSPSESGTTNNCSGELGGFAWSEQKGWMSMTGVTIDASGHFTGTAGTAGTDAGRISFDCDDYCNVTTDWRHSCDGESDDDDDDNDDDNDDDDESSGGSKVSMSQKNTNTTTDTNTEESKTSMADSGAQLFEQNSEIALEKESVFSSVFGFFAGYIDNYSCYWNILLLIVYTLLILSIFRKTRITRVTKASFIVGPIILAFILPLLKLCWILPPICAILISLGFLLRKKSLNRNQNTKLNT